MDATKGLTALTAEMGCSFGTVVWNWTVVSDATLQLKITFSCHLITRTVISTATFELVNNYYEWHLGPQTWTDFLFLFFMTENAVKKKQNHLFSDKIRFIYLKN
jgi:hypothetical protein